MTNKSQREAFLSYEADAWFERNKPYIKSYDHTKDRVIELMQDYGLDPSTVLEIGCSAGHRLNGIKKVFPNAKPSGIEPSKQAVQYGSSTYPDIHLVTGTADDLGKFVDGSMDVVIVGFVFYVIDRQIVFKTIAEIDRVLKNHGVLILVDFFSETALKHEYSHISEFSAYSYKQNYDEIFTSSKMYYLLDKSTMNHNTKSRDASADYYNKYSISLLKKDTVASYK